MIGRKDRSMILKKELNRIIGKLDKSKIDRIILFGSMATGRINMASDIDLIIIKDTKKRFLDRLDDIYTAVLPSVDVDILVYTPKEVKDMQGWSVFLKKALGEGRVLYEAK